MNSGNELRRVSSPGLSGLLSRLRLSRVEDELAVLGVAQVATEALLGAQVGAWKFEAIELQCRESVYWPEFCVLAKAGLVPEDWLPGALGRVVLAWAKGKGGDR